MRTLTERTNTWSAAPTDMPTARAGMYAVAAKGGTVYVTTVFMAFQLALLEALSS